jgi:hypothetical protein
MGYQGRWNQILTQLRLDFNSDEVRFGLRDPDLLYEKDISNL